MCLTLCDPMNDSTPGLPVHHHLPEFTQTHVHRVSDAIQPSHPLSSPFPCPQSLPASESFPMSQLFAWGGQSTGASALASFLPKNTQGQSPLEWTGWISLQSKGLSRVFSSTTFLIMMHKIFIFSHNLVRVFVNDRKRDLHIQYFPSFLRHQVWGPCSSSLEPSPFQTHPQPLCKVPRGLRILRGGGGGVAAGREKGKESSPGERIPTPHADFYKPLSLFVEPRKVFFSP